MSVNELSLVIMACMFYTYTDPNTPTQTARIVGWTVMYMITAIIIMNIIVLWTLKIKYWRKDIKTLIQYFKTVCYFS